MSSDLYQTLLLWDGAGLLARCDGVEVRLRRWPAGLLVGLPVTELKFNPCIRECEVRESARGWREMRVDERTAAMSWLKRVSAAALAETDN